MSETVQKKMEEFPAPDINRLSNIMQRTHTLDTAPQAVIDFVNLISASFPFNLSPKKLTKLRAQFAYSLICTISDNHPDFFRPLFQRAVTDGLIIPEQFTQENVNKKINNKQLLPRP